MKVLLLIAMLLLSSCGVQRQLNNLKHDRDVQQAAIDETQTQVTQLQQLTANMGSTIVALLDQQKRLQATKVDTTTLLSIIASLQAQQTVMMKQIAQLQANSRK